MNNDYRALSEEEITTLINQQCESDNWSLVKVHSKFDFSRLNNCTFSGNVQLGLFKGTKTFFGGVKKKCGIFNSHIHNCVIGDDVYINNVRNFIANYNIGNKTTIENIDILAVEGNSSFGNGILVDVLQEDGSRAVPIFDKLSSHHAYLMAFYKHRPKLVENLKEISKEYTQSVTSEIGTIESNVSIINCGSIKNVRIGENTFIEGTDSLENGSINSVSQAPVIIGDSVIMKNFIVSSGSKVTDGTLVFNCFIGQGCNLTKQYSADSSLFFANCGGSHGEAWSIFAGPYTVTYHKSTLLIAGLFSFLNAGSGSNQSNHMYKLGPVHQGIVERGSKTTSDSYLLWPSKIGAFTLVMGRHYRNSDTSNLPFSYLIENDDESILVPAVNLRSVGTIRDSRKWPARDKRTDNRKLDNINFDLLSPYTIQKMINGIQILEKLKEFSGETSDFYFYNSVKIKNTSLNSGIKLYKMAIDKFIGNTVIKHLEDIDFKDLNHLKDSMKTSTPKGKGEWFDLCGMLLPHDVGDEFLDTIESGKISTLKELQSTLLAIHKNYREYQWTWIIDILEKMFEKSISDFTVEDVIKIVNNWQDSVIKLDKMLISDAKKEFSVHSQTGFGLDGDLIRKQVDFKEVRGTFEDNQFVVDVENHIKAKTALGEEIRNRLMKLI